MVHWILIDLPEYISIHFFFLLYVSIIINFFQVLLLNVNSIYRIIQSLIRENSIRYHYFQFCQRLIQNWWDNGWFNHRMWNSIEIFSWLYSSFPAPQFHNLNFETWLFEKVQEFHCSKRNGKNIQHSLQVSDQVTLS